MDLKTICLCCYEAPRHQNGWNNTKYCIPCAKLVSSRKPLTPAQEKFIRDNAKLKTAAELSLDMRIAERQILYFTRGKFIQLKRPVLDDYDA